MDQGGQRRRPESGGYARGDEKRTRIVEAALRRFGEDGYRGASTRQIAQDAGANHPAIQYYFGGKEGLYGACVEYVIDGFRDALQDAYSQAEQAGTDRQAALDALCLIIATATEYLHDTIEGDGWGRFVTRARNHDDSGPMSEDKAQGFVDEFYGACIKLVGILMGDKPETDILFRTFMILGPFSIFSHSKPDILARFGWPDFRGQRLDMLKSMLISNIREVLGADRGRRPPLSSRAMRGQGQTQSGYKTE